MAQDQISRRRLLGLLVAAGAASQPRAALAEGLSGDPEASRVAKLIGGAAQVLPPPDDPDFGTFFERLGEARVVLLGEATHGTSEFYQARAEITKRLIRYHGFTVVAVEADWPDAGHIDAYINGRERPLSPNIPFQGFPTWMWRNEEILALVDWLRDHNASVSNRSQHVGFHGLDLYSLGS